jgi:adenine-specific DNA-methyltransferase
MGMIGGGNEKHGTHQVLPSSGPAREALRVKGQFWTPPWLAKAMAAWVTGRQPSLLFDPAVGPGTFFSAAKEMGFTGKFAGFELDDEALSEAYKLGLSSAELAGIQIGDFIRDPIEGRYPAIISNPPYIRHHRLSFQQKSELRDLAMRYLGFSLDGRVGLHVYFLLKCLEHLSPDGRLAFLLPADICEGVSSTPFWARVAERFHIDAIITFDETAVPFPSVDTNAIVFMLSNRRPTRNVLWARVQKPHTAAVLDVLSSRRTPSAIVQNRELPELLATGMSRPLRTHSSRGVPLSAFARVMRGIATGANEFFFLTSAQIQEYQLDKKYFKRAIGRTRDCRHEKLEKEDIEALDKAGRPTWLLSIAKQSKEQLTASLRDYLEMGERLGLHEKSLIKTRRPWYRMEERNVPGLLFAYLGRRDCRFIENCAGVVPLTGFLCVYPWDDSAEFRGKLWRALNHPQTIANLLFVGKSYGGGAIKVEPRQLDSLEIPASVIAEVGLSPVESFSQTQLLDKRAPFSAGFKI